MCWLIHPDLVAYNAASHATGVAKSWQHSLQLLRSMKRRYFVCILVSCIFFSCPALSSAIFNHLNLAFSVVSDTCGPVAARYSKTSTKFSSYNRAKEAKPFNPDSDKICGKRNATPFQIVNAYDDYRPPGNIDSKTCCVFGFSRWREKTSFWLLNWSWFQSCGDSRFFHEAALIEELDPATYGTIVMATGSVSHWCRSLFHLQEMTWQNFHVDTGIISSAACGCEKRWEQFRPQRIVFSWALSI